ncbi:MAG: TetR/AcrR family transcriptional regulator [Sandaracinaceae bacterium]
MGKPTGSYHHGDLRRALIDASLELIQQRGVQGLSLRAAARRAGVSPGAPYHHFENRSALLSAIGTDGFRILGEEMAKAAAESPDPERGQLQACGIAYVRFALKYPAHFKVMFRPELTDHDEHPELKEAGDPVFQLLVQRVMAAQELGEAPTGDPEPYVLLAWSCVQGLSSLLLDGPIGADYDKISIPPERMAEVLTSTLSALLRDAATAQALGATRGSGSPDPGTDPGAPPDGS